MNDRRVSSKIKNLSNKSVLNCRIMSTQPSVSVWVCVWRGAVFVRRAFLEKPGSQTRPEVFTTCWCWRGRCDLLQPLMNTHTHMYIHANSPYPTHIHTQRPPPCLPTHTHPGRVSVPPSTPALAPGLCPALDRRLSRTVDTPASHSACAWLLLARLLLASSTQPCATHPNTVHS